jgi:hypothetical protein
MGRELRPGLGHFVDIDNGGELSLSWPQVRLEGHMSVPTFDVSVVP